MLKGALQESVIEKDNAKKKLAQSQDIVIKTLRENKVLNDELNMINDLIGETMGNIDETSNEKLHDENA